MRRSDREITDIGRIEEFIATEQIIRVGLQRRVVKSSGSFPSGCG